ncbi:Acetyltransferase (GNAT) domain-containing protein [Rhodobacter sp. 24-YEA-8]|nr:Acetyltransferase (GNAT) domain-containing protein [Rhodobacter sp. 24-YEA-8]
MIRRATADDLARVDLLIKAHPSALMDKGIDQLHEMLEAEDCEILIREDQGFAGFATLHMLYDQVWYLDNFAVDGPGQGQKLIRDMLAVVFDELGAHRLMCDVVFDNAAGMTAMRRAGFTFEGNMRQCWKRGGIWVDCHAFSMLAPEWQKIRG